MILITGAGGWLGSELTEQLLKKGNKIRALNNIETESLKRLKEEYKDNLEIVLGNICNENDVRNSMVGIKQVYHLAAKVHFIPTNRSEEEDFFNINTSATERIFEECIKNNVERVVFFSTVSVYEQTNNLINENSNKNPITVYGKSKLEAEKIANKLYEEQKLPITIIEPVTVYGNGDVGNFKKLENLIQKGLCVRFGNGKNKKTVIYYKDLITMVVNIGEDKETVGKTIICGTETITVKEINSILIKKFKKRVLKIVIPTVISKIIAKICCFSIFKKIRRRIVALMQNNEFDLSQSSKYISNSKKFEEFQNER